MTSQGGPTLKDFGKHAACRGKKDYEISVHPSLSYRAQVQAHGLGASNYLLAFLLKYHKNSRCMNALGPEVVIFRSHVDIVSQKQCVRAMMQPPVILLECMLMKGTCLFPRMTQ